DPFLYRADARGVAPHGRVIRDAQQLAEGCGEKSGDVDVDVDGPLDHESANEAVDDDGEVVGVVVQFDAELGALIDQELGEFSTTGQVEFPQPKAQFGVGRGNCVELDLCSAPLAGARDFTS